MSGADLRRYRKHSSGLVFRVAYQARSPDGPIGLEGVLDPGLTHEVSASALGVDFTRCDLSNEHSPTCEKCGGEKLRVGGARGWHCLWCTNQHRPLMTGAEVMVTPGACLNMTAEDAAEAAREPVAMILPPPPSRPVPAPAPTPAPSRDSATIPAGLPHTSCVLRAWVYASALSARYFGLPVYIVGGALTDPNPRDVDIVIPMPDDLFLAAYGDSKVFNMAQWESGMRDANPPTMWLRWARDCAKQSRAMTMFCARAVDFKTQPESYFKTFEGKPRVRLDCGIMRESAEVTAPPSSP